MENDTTKMYNDLYFSMIDLFLQIIYRTAENHSRLYQWVFVSLILMQKLIKSKFYQCSIKNHIIFAINLSYYVFL